MNRLCYTLGVLVIFLVSSVASQTQVSGVGITGKGIKVGTGFSSFSTNSIEFEAESRGGFNAGIFLTYNIKPQLAIQPELWYMDKGIGAGNFLLMDGFQLNYLEIPVLLKYSLKGGPKITPSFFAGPAISILTGARLYNDGIFSIISSSSYDYDVKDGLKSIDLCIVFGGEIEFRTFRSKKFILDVRYSLGLTNVMDVAKWNAARTAVDEHEWWIFSWADYDRPLLADGVSIKNRTLSIMLGLKF